MKTLFYKPIVHILLIFILGFLAYSNTFHVPFQFDDMVNIVENVKLGDFNNFWPPSGTRWFGFLTFALNYKLGGLDTTGYHIFNISIHIINAILVYYLVALTLRIQDAGYRIQDFNPPKSPFSKGGLRGIYLHRASWIMHHHLIALFSALIFVAHPIQTQAVTYIVQRFASLATFFYLLSLVMYVKFRIQNTEVRSQNTPSIALPPRWGGMGGGAVAEDKDKVKVKAEVKAKDKAFSTSTFYFISVLSAVLAMKTKEIAFTLPFIIALYEFCFFKSQNYELRAMNLRRLLYLMPFLLTVLIIPLSLIGIDKPIGDAIGELRTAAVETTAIGRWSYLFTQFRVIVTYIRLLFLPLNQNLDYDYPIYHSFLNVEVFLSFLFLLSILILGIYLLYRSRLKKVHSSLLIAHSNNELPTMSHELRATSYKLRAMSNERLISFGISWFFITILVESSVIPIRDVIFEHRLYLPSIGAFIAVNTFLFIVAEKLKQRWEKVESGVIVAIAVIIVVFAGATYARNTVWKDEFTLWKDVVNKSPNKARGHHELGFAYQSKGFINKADEQHRIAIKVAYQSKGYSDEKVIEQYQIILRSTPYDPAVHNNLGLAYRYKGLTDKGIEHLQIALKLKPDFIAAHVNLGNAYISKGLTDKAIEQYKIALRLKADIPEAYYNLGNAYFSKGMIDNAIENYERAINLDPDDPDAHIYLGFAYFRKELTNEAKKHLRIAEKLIDKLK